MFIAYVPGKGYYTNKDWSYDIAKARQFRSSSVLVALMKRMKLRFQIKQIVKGKVLDQPNRKHY